jgi:hypothetical protein
MRKFAFTSGFALSVLLLVGACSEQVDAPTQEPSPAEAGTQTGGTADDAGAAASEASTADAVDTIPATFHGIWDYVEGTCALESDLRMEISGGEILFYESIGTVTASVPDEGDVIVTLAMEGEGETWVQAYRLTLSEDDQILNSQAIGEDFVGGPLPRKRCAASEVDG